MPAPHVKSPKIYKPTMEEFRDFSKFVERIEKEDEAHKIGICKIIPPEEWVPRKKGYALKVKLVSVELNHYYILSFSAWLFPWSVQLLMNMRQLQFFFNY